MAQIQDLKPLCAAPLAHHLRRALLILSTAPHRTCQEPLLLFVPEGEAFEQHFHKSNEQSLRAVSSNSRSVLPRQLGREYVHEFFRLLFFRLLLFLRKKKEKKNRRGASGRGCRKGSVTCEAVMLHSLTSRAEHLGNEVQVPKKELFPLSYASLRRLSPSSAHSSVLLTFPLGMMRNLRPTLHSHSITIPLAPNSLPLPRARSPQTFATTWLQTL